MLNPYNFYSNERGKYTFRFKRFNDKLWEHDIKAGSERLIKNICNKYNVQI